jgi:hypothetical protein
MGWIKGEIMRGIAQKEIDMGIAHEMEHTKSPRVAERIAMDHLREDPKYYTHLTKCFKNISKESIKAYTQFHGVPPSEITYWDKAWYPGELVYLGRGVDIGYDTTQIVSTKDGWYVHDWGPWVKVYRRPINKREKYDYFMKNFAKDPWMLGRGLGLTYAPDGADYDIEVFCKKTDKLAASKDKKKLIVIDDKGVLYIAWGGKMRVDTWIRD